jgi:hypothetical protein
MEEDAGSVATPNRIAEEAAHGRLSRLSRCWAMGLMVVGINQYNTYKHHHPEANLLCHQWHCLVTLKKDKR